MPSESTLAAIIRFADAARRDRRANAAAAGDGTALELLLAPRLRTLLEALLAEHLPQAPRLLPEYTKGGLGRPDLAFAREGAPARAFIELKQPATALDRARLRGHDADQFDRFSELPIWGFCNFHGIRLYRRAELVAAAVLLPAICLDPATADAAAERAIRRHDPAPFLAVLEALALAAPVAPRTAEQAADALAHAARLVNHVVLAQCRAGAPPALADVQREFSRTLFAHPAAGGYDDPDEDALFAGAFAQTLAFGLLLAREAGARRRPPGSRERQAELLLPRDIDRNAYQALPEGTYPLLRATLRALTQDEILELLAAAFDVMQDTVNAIDIDLLAPRAGADPILYFYEHFLATFDPEARKKRGVFFTPVPVVRFMVAETDRALRRSGADQGLLDPHVLLLDPACGTGTFLIAAADAVASAAAAAYGPDAVPAELSALADRLHGLELLVGPYTVAHYRLLRALTPADRAPDRRMSIYLADTLAPPTGAAGVTPHMGFMSAPIVREREEADRLKRDTPIIAIIGNPPYRRLEEGEANALERGWDNGFWEDLKAPVREAGWGGDLNTFPDLYIAFWRWCLWKLFESSGAPGRGVLSLITNRTFLAGHPYAGLRRMLRRRFDTIDIVDLRGDSRGARPAGITVDENVFAVQAGVCILTAVATGAPRKRGVEARVRYADVWRHGAFRAREKLALLDAAQADPAALNFFEIAGTDLADFVPTAFACVDWSGLHRLFAFRSSGIQTKRDDFAYALKPAVLKARMAELGSLANPEAAKRFHETAARKALAAQQTGWHPEAIRDIVYRPLDRRKFYDVQAFIDRRRTQLRAAWGEANVALYALPSGTGAGPAVWVHGLLPDYHAFRGSYGGYAMPLWDRRDGADQPNFAPGLLPALARAYSGPVVPEAAFNAIAALLSASSYTSRFAWDLEESFAHVPFPLDGAVFADAARIGAEIRALETFGRDPGAGFRSTRLVGRASGLTLAMPPAARAFQEAGDGSGFVALLPDQSLRLAGVPERVWQFAVSGYRVLPRWLESRRGEALDAALQRAMLDIAWRIEELLHWFDAADPLLAQAIAAPLPVARLGLAPLEPASRLV